MEPTFKILSSNTLPEHTNLFAQINLWGVNYVITSTNDACVATISYHFPPDTNIEKAAVHIKQSVLTEPFLQHQFDTVTIVYALPVALLVPNALMPGVDQKSMLELVHGEINDAYIRSEFSYKQQLHIVYAIPKPIDAVISYLFPSAIIRHQFGLLSDTLPVGDNYLYCIFGNHQFTVQLTKAGKLQVLQSFSFKTPEDAVYYLLQLCSTHALDAAELPLQLNGMVDASSPLYSELNKYFGQVQLQGLPSQLSFPDDISQVPAHYFSHLFQMLLCV